MGNNQLWQSRVEIQHYSVAYLSRLKHCSAELPLKARAHMLNINGWIQDKSMQCIWAFASSALQHFDHGNVLENATE